MDEQVLRDALTRWCGPDMVASVQASGLSHVESSLAEVSAVRAIYERRRRRAGLNPELLPKIDGVLQALSSVGTDEEILMIHVVTGRGNGAIVLADRACSPLFAFETNSTNISGD